jgi:hypothetical protein
MSDSPVSYRLRYSAVEYSRRGGQMSSLLFSLAQQALIWEAEGKAVEQVHCHLSGDGDYMGVALVDAPATVIDEVAA